MLLKIVVVAVVVIVLLILGVWFLAGRRRSYEAILDDVWARLRAVPEGEAFEPASEAVAALPTPARRYLTHAIAAGTPLAGSVALEMIGKMRLEAGADKAPFEARQVLAAPQGMIWRAEVGKGWKKITGADAYAKGAGELRWYLWRTIPVASGGGSDVSRSAAGRVALESVLFLPSALHPERGARWEAVDDRTARVHLQVGEHELVPEIRVSPAGSLLRIEMMRWDPEGPSGKPEEVRWVVDGFEDEETFGGHTFPTTFRVTKNAGTPHLDTFFEGRILSADYEPGPPVPEEEPPEDEPDEDEAQEEEEAEEERAAEKEEEDAKSAEEAEEKEKEAPESKSDRSTTARSESRERAPDRATASEERPRRTE